MSNEFYNVTGTPGQRAFGSSAAIRAEFIALQSAFDKMGALSGGALKVLRVNAGETGYEADPNTYLTDVAGAASFVLKVGDTMFGALDVRANSTTPLALRNTLLDGGSSAGFTGLVLGDSGSAVAMIQRSKRAINQAGLVLNVEYGFSTPVKVAEFHRDGIDLYVGAAAALGIVPAAATFVPPVFAPNFLVGTGLATQTGTFGFVGGVGGAFEAYGSASAGAGQVRLVTASIPRLVVDVSGNVGIGALTTLLAGAPLQVHVTTNQKAVFLSQASAVCMAGVTDAGASTTLRLAGNPLILSGDGSSDHVRLDSGGNLGLGVSSFVGGTQHILGLASTSAPGSSITGVGQLYVESGALKYRGPGGTVTTLAPT